MINLMVSLLMLVQGVSAPGIQSGIVEGRVLAIDGKPAAGVRVTATVAPDTGAPAAEAAVMASIVQTDADGHFRLERIPPGRYYITAGLVDFPTYYPGVTGIGEAKVFAVTAGALLSGIDFPMARPAGLKVIGHVVREGNQAPPANQRVLLTGSRLPSQTVLLPADGVFEFVNVPPGNYTIGLSPANGSRPYQIAVNDKDVQVDIAAPAVFAVTGKMVIENDGPRPRIALTFTDGTNRVTSSIASDGTYTVQLPAGNYQISTISMPAGFRMKSLISDTTDLLREPLKVMANSSPQFIMTLGVSSPPPWVRVKGHVGGGVSGARISMIGSSAGEILQEIVQPDGSFEFSKVIPGSYTVRLTGGAATQSIAPLTLNVGDMDVDGWEIVLPATATISGHATIVGTPTSVSNRTNLTFSFSNSASGSSTLTSSFGPDGSFSLNLPVGSQQLSLPRPPAGYVVKSMTYGSVNLLTSPLIVDSKGIPAELNVILERSSAVPSFKVSLKLTGNVQSWEDIRMTLSGAGGAQEAILNSAGAYEISGILPGNYTARAFSSSRGIAMSVPVVVASKDLTDIEIQFPRQKEVLGHIALETGGPIQPQFWFTLNGANTATIYSLAQRDGSFKAFLPEGEWKFSVGGLPNDFSVKSLTYGDNDLTRNSLKVTAADTQELRMNLATSATTSWVKLSGRFIAPKLGNLLPKQMNLMGSMRIETELMPDGSFEFPRILPGTYSWCCTSGYTSITVPKRDVSNLILRSITGRVVLEEGTQQSGTYVQANDGSGTSAASVSQDGSFTLIVPEGTFRMAVTEIPAGFYVKSIRYGATELVNQMLNVLPGQDASDLQLVIARRP